MHRQELLTKHKMLCSEFLEQNYDRVFDQHYKQLLHSENYVTRRQSLKLLGELLLDRHNFSVMTKYISSPDNLKLMMNMLKERSRNIQFEAFHVFKVGCCRKVWVACGGNEYQFYCSGCVITFTFSDCCFLVVTSFFAVVLILRSLFCWKLPVDP